MDEPTSKGAKLIEHWQACKGELESAKREVNRLHCALENSVNKLGRWMVPDDMAVGETLSVWHGDSLIAVTKDDDNGSGSFSVKVRRSGKRHPCF